MIDPSATAMEEDRPRAGGEVGRRALGHSGILVSEIGFGAWGIGGLSAGPTSYGPTDDEESLKALRRAFDAGVNFYDTSPVYGGGHSEELIGEAFSGCRDQVVVATKAGVTAYGEPPDWRPDSLRRSLDDSLRRLRGEYVDLFQLHNPPRSVMRADGEVAALFAELIGNGKIRAVGVSVREPADGLAAIEAFRPAALQVNVNLLDHRFRECGLLDAARRAETSLLARTPLCFGFLTGTLAADATFAESDHRSRWSRQQVARWVEGARLMAECMDRRTEQSPAVFALRFCLSFPEVAAVLPGCLTAAEVSENCAAAWLGALTPGEMQAVNSAYRGWEDAKPRRPISLADDPAKL